MFATLRARALPAGSPGRPTPLPAPLVEPVADAKAWHALDRVIGHPSSIECARRIGADCTFASIGGETEHALPCPQPRHDPVELRFAGGLVHRFWSGRAREALLLLQGHLRLSGDVAGAFDLLRGLPDLSRSYRHVAGVELESAPRMNVLRHFSVDGPRATALGLGSRFSTDDDRDCVGFVAALLLGLHPVCRSIELRALAGELSRGTVSAPLVFALAELIAELEVSDPALAPSAPVT